MEKVDFTETKYWGTAEGNKIPVEEVTHQHWSNIYWYHLYAKDDFDMQAFIQKDKLEYIMGLALYHLNLRFGGKILEWQIKYQWEENWYKNYVKDQNTRFMLIEIVR